VSARMELPVVVVGADCAVLGAAAVDGNGAPAYCARVDSQSPETVWSPQPERLRTAGSRPPTAP
jgi:serine/threonine-protein kinase